jgi:hypothetical protein
MADGERSPFDVSIAPKFVYKWGTYPYMWSVSHVVFLSKHVTGVGFALHPISAGSTFPLSPSAPRQNLVSPSVPSQNFS